MIGRKVKRIQPHIRWMIRRDMLEVLEIERHSFSEPKDENEMVALLRQRNCIGMVCEFEERIVGFMIYELHKTRLTLVDMAVHAEFRRCKVGSQMIDKLRTKLSHDKRTKVCTEVGETNLGALLFFKSVGFIATEIIGTGDETKYAMTMEHARRSSYSITNRIW